MRWLLLCVLALQAATCGQRGPLTLPEQRQSVSPTVAVVA
jgi:predicted small lipoprotein YifL